MRRLLCIVSAMNAGGAETFLMKMYRAIDRNKYQMDFLVNADTNYYEKEILEMGGKIYRIPAKSQSLFGWYRGTKKIIHDNRYKYVIRVCEHSLATLDLLVAKAGGATHLIMRSSNAYSGSKKSVLLHKIFKVLPMTVPNVKLAPSTEAAEYTFGKGCVERGKVVLLHNAIDTSIYQFDSAEREKIRKELGIAEEFVVGHVGRFNQQKNHEFLIDVFFEIKKIRNDAKLILCGKGEKEQEIRNKVEKLGLSDSVLFLGVRSDIPAILSAMDVFVFTSFYEGMPNTVIEAQATGVPCYVSDRVTKEARVTDLVTYLSIEQLPIEWAKICSNQINLNRSKYKEILKEEGYDILDVVPQFVKLTFESNT